ncbi:rhamnose ABC transporter substrate-binding protein [Faecalicatena orotica]|uniref:Monosaccharide ABC transporter substrate-binding protein (CUT2 family) n=1 Tax=Faecalicatena orotica TaxID=1544 RepID=A0A2Y9BMP4_9FIRM|nr:autoinducer 2 ABC transporter substrate-binding protein [Faecalicatena orotica]PWJ19049.1 monosaccharide ABC transporter substrate-binding protein (CUT2 family) [Faecalicatena orotica]SSA58692.1 monosaccharide ABC transporter substrate-binding protein, CUT2 family [Faecalicatena orotica]
MKAKELMKRAAGGALAAVMVLSMLTGCSKTEAPKAETKTEDDASKDAKDSDGDMTIAMLPKFKGENYFDACKTGAQEAADELGITLLYDGPSQDQATNQKQVDILEGWIAQGVNVIVVSPNDPTAIAPTLKKAQDAGIKVVTFDADAQEDSRDIFVNQITAESAAKGLLDGAANDLKAKGYGADKTANIALVSSSGTDANQKAWEDAINALLETDDYNFMKIKNKETDVYYPGTDETKVNSECATLIGRMGEGEDKIQAAIGLSSMATPALGAQYQSASSKPDAKIVSMTGLATPNALKTYIKDDENPLNSGVLWNCMDLGYLAVQTAYQLSEGTITPDATTIDAGRLGAKDIVDAQCVLGDALVFDASNVDEFDY